MTDNTSETRTLPVEGKTVSRVILDGRFILAFNEQTDSAAGYELTIEQPFTCWIGEHSARKSLVDPQDAGQDTDHLGQAASALHKICKRAVAFEEGRVSLLFNNALHIDVRPHQLYEAWSLVAVQQPGLRVVARPGGGLAVWG
jgi:hypothetical protein